MASPMIPHGGQGQRGIHLGYKKSKSTGTRRFYRPPPVDEKPIDDGLLWERKMGWCDRCMRNKIWQKRKEEKGGGWLCLGCECNVEPEPPATH